MQEKGVIDNNVLSSKGFWNGGGLRKYNRKFQILSLMRCHWQGMVTRENSFLVCRKSVFHCYKAETLRNSNRYGFLHLLPAQHCHKKGWQNHWLDAWGSMDAITPLQTTLLRSVLEHLCNSDACVMKGKWNIL